MTVGPSAAYAGSGALLQFSGGAVGSSLSGVTVQGSGGTGISSSVRIAVQRSPIFNATTPVAPFAEASASRTRSVISISCVFRSVLREISRTGLSYEPAWRSRSPKVRSTH